jgi:hypothetical protein
LPKTMLHQPQPFPSYHAIIALPPKASGLPS